MATLTLVCSTTDLYAMPACVMLYSALSNLAADRSVAVYVVDHGISGRTREKMTTCLERFKPQLELRFCKPVPSALTGVSSSAISAAVFDRFILTRLLANQTRRTIFIDVDMVVQGDLSVLWDADFEGSALMAVQDFYFPNLFDRMVHLRDPRATDVDRAQPYINGGLQVCNLDAWREMQLEQQVIDDLGKNISRYGFPDQDATNIVLHPFIKLLPPSWNVQANAVSRGPGQAAIVRDGVDLALRNWNQAHVIHYAGAVKPWTTLRLRGPLREAQRRFFQYARASRWNTGISYHMWRKQLWLGWLQRQLQKVMSAVLLYRDQVAGRQRC